MKKNYTKPNLHIEMFVTEDVMADSTNLLFAKKLSDLNIEGEGDITLTESSLYSIDYAKFAL